MILVPDQGPAQRFAPEVPDLLRTVARNRADESAVGEEMVARLDHAELVLFGVGEHNMSGIRALANVDVARAECERTGYGLLLVAEGRACQVEVHVVLANLRLISRQKSNLEPSAITR